MAVVAYPSCLPEATGKRPALCVAVSPEGPRHNAGHPCHPAAMTTITAKGHKGTIHFDGLTVTIERKGFLARAATGKGSKQVPVRSFTAVQFKPAGLVVNGFIQFTIAGGIERRSQFGRSTTDAAHDENSVVFTYGQRAVFEELGDAVQAAVATGGTAAAPAPASADVSERMRQLAVMLEQGLVTPH
jgi:uncharacterized protein DUF4429